MLYFKKVHLRISQREMQKKAIAMLIEPAVGRGKKLWQVIISELNVIKKQTAKKL